MKTALHGLMLYFANLTGIVTGAITFQVIGGDQLSIQIPTAVIVSILFFVLYWHVLRKLTGKKLTTEPLHLIRVFVAALCWHPVIFIPLHYFTQGYLTGPGNIVAVMLFQIPVNAITLAFPFFYNGQSSQNRHS